MVRKRKPKKPSGAAQAGSGPCVPSATPLFLKEATEGCYVVDKTRRKAQQWWLGFDELPPGLDPAEVPEIGLDPSSGVLSAVNINGSERSFTISVRGSSAQGVVGNRDAPLPCGTHRDEEGVEHPCITFIAVVPACSILDLCFLPTASLDGVDIDSDVQQVTRHTAPDRLPHPHHASLGFPLEGGPFLCTQGFGAPFTHHFAGNFHSVDFRCPVGTPVLSVGPGTVLKVADSNKVSGVHVSSLFKWNSVTIALDCGGVAEYVHLQHGSASVAPGDAVSEGQTIALSGDIGFSPEPHLHFQLLQSPEDTAESVPFAFATRSAAGEGTDDGGACGDAPQLPPVASPSTDPPITPEGVGCVPLCGRWYSAHGEVPPPSAEEGDDMGEKGKGGTPTPQGPPLPAA